MESRPSLTARRTVFLIAVVITAGVLANALRAQQQPAPAKVPESVAISSPSETQSAGDKAGSVPQDSQPDRRSLKEAVGDRFKIGVGVSHVVVQNAEDAALIRQHFQILTPENCMKPQGIHPAEDQWNFEPTDRFVDFARTNKLEVVGHCLVWAKDDRTDEWMMKEHGEPVSRETLLRRIETHINTVVQRYADAVTMWDVVNEAIGDSQEGLLRDSVYSRTTGIDFIVTAFKAARAKDPDALLIYNDYNGHKPGKREKLIELLTQLKQRGAPVDAYGMQGHFELGDDSVPQLRETFDQLRKLDIRVVVSELDIDVVTRGRWWADGGKYRNELATHDPYKNGVPDEVQQKQIEQYVELFRLFDEYSDIIERVSFWNLHDGQSWLNNFPWRRVNYPLLFDRNRRPKPVFDAVYESLRNATSASLHAPVPRRDGNSRIAHEQLLTKTKQGKIDVYLQGDSIRTLVAFFIASPPLVFSLSRVVAGEAIHRRATSDRRCELDLRHPRRVAAGRGARQTPLRVIGVCLAWGAFLSVTDAISQDRVDDQPPTPPVVDGSVVREVWPGHYELLKTRSEKSRKALANSLRRPDAKPVTVAVWQMRNHCDGERGKRENLRRMIEVIERGGREGVQILALPEMCLPGYFTRSAGTPAEAARANRVLADEPTQSYYLKRLCDAARVSRMVVAFGFCEREAGKYYNSIGVIDADGAWLGTRRKNPLSPTPYDLESFTEPPAEQRCAVFRTRHATIGVSNCFDGEFPESIRRMRLAGAEVLLWCNAATGNVALGSSNRIHHSASYAQANRMWVACCNAVGEECYGTSAIVGPAGDPLVVLPTDREVLGLSTINLSLGADWDRWRQRLDPQLLAPLSTCPQERAGQDQ